MSTIRKFNNQLPFEEINDLLVGSGNEDGLLLIGSSGITSEQKNSCDQRTFTVCKNPNAISAVMIHQAIEFGDQENIIAICMSMNEIIVKTMTAIEAHKRKSVINN